MNTCILKFLLINWFAECVCPFKDSFPVYITSKGAWTGSCNDLYYCHCLTTDADASTFVAVRVKPPVETTNNTTLLNEATAKYPISNIVRIFVPAEIVTPVVPGDETGGNITPGGRDYERELLLAYAVLGPFAGILLISTVVLAVLFARARRRAERRSWFQTRAAQGGLNGHSMDVRTSDETLNAPKRQKPRRLVDEGSATQERNLNGDGIKERRKASGATPTSEFVRLSAAFGESTGTVDSSFDGRRGDDQGCRPAKFS